MPRLPMHLLVLGVTALLTAVAGCDSTAPYEPATRLGFSQQPTPTTAGAVVSPAVTVSVLTAGGDRSTGSSVTITVAITVGTGAAGAILGGTTTRTAVNGVATFNDLTLDKAGTGYTITATSSTLTAATSTGFAVTAGAASALTFRTQPATAEAGVPISPAVEVQALDAYGNPASGNVTIAIAPGTGAAGAVLGGTLTKPTANGIATFDDLTVDKAAGGYTLAATGAAAPTATSDLFGVMAGPPAVLIALAGDGQSAPVGTAPPVMPSVEVRDQFGNLVPSAAVVFTVTQGSGIIIDTFHVTGADGRATLGGWEVDGLGINRVTALTAGGAITTPFTATASNLSFAYTPDVIGGGWTLWAANEDTIFVGGGFQLLRYFNGTTWSSMTSALGANTYGICGRASTDVYTTGQWGVQHYAGTSWASILGGTDEIIDCWAGTSTVYAVGDGTLRVYANGSWTSIPTGLSQAFNVDRLEQVWGTGTGVVYAAGRPGVLKYDGVAAALVPGLPANMVGIHGSSADNVFAVGSNGAIWRYDGTSWAPMNSGTTETLTGVAALSPKNVYVVGNTGLLLRYDGIDWQPVSTGNTSAWYSEIQALSATSLLITAPPGMLAGKP